MDHGKYHDVISFAIDLLRARGEQFTPVADAMAEGREITYGRFFFKLYAFILLTSTLVPGINYFVVYNSSSSSVTGSEDE